MKDIDFLPADVTRQHAAHARLRGQVITVAVVVSGLLLAWFAITMQVTQVTSELAALSAPYERARGQQLQLRQLQEQLRQVAGEAELYAYLQYHWPRTRLLAQLVAPLSDEIVLTEVRLDREPPASIVRQTSAVTAPAEGNEPLDAARHDLEQLSAADDQPLFIDCSGLTKNATALHTVLADLGKSPLVAQTRLISLSSAEPDHPGWLKFNCRVHFVEPSPTPVPAEGQQVTRLGTEALR